jgi:hypothetical protein
MPKERDEDAAFSFDWMLAKSQNASLFANVWVVGCAGL